MTSGGSIEGISLLRIGGNDLLTSMGTNRILSETLKRFHTHLSIGPDKSLGALSIFVSKNVCGEFKRGR